MFTGIIEDIGKVVSVQRGAQSARLTVDAPIASQGTQLGDSIAINGTCLTVVEIAGNRLSFDAVPETIQRTSLKAIRSGDGVNLERALAFGQRLGGHLVQGHVDGTGTLLDITERENAHILRIGAPPELMRYILSKGSVALDGISLTVVDVGADWFTVWIIPHTFAHTTLHERKIGDPLNIENDLIARYVEKLLLSKGDAAAPSSLTFDKLVEAGFMET